MRHLLAPRMTPDLLARYELVVGLEVHAQLATHAKAFSPDDAAFGGAPNTHVDPISLGHPGTLPVLNARVVAYALRMGLATNCRIAPRSVFARKHYFYPDLPKGYQISQFETPLCAEGFVDIVAEEETGPVARRIGLTRIHLEEDAGKSIHDQDPYATLIDHNRCGVPLIEIVSEPEIRTPREAAAYLTRIRQLVRYLGICDGNMEEGSLRCDANVSVRPRGQTALGTKAEIKNLNSIRHVERAIAYEAERQMRLLEGGGAVVQETRLWDAHRQETRSMRSKEEAHDYRYFPDPDLPPIAVTEALLAEVRAHLPELPEARSARFVAELGLPPYDAAVLTEDRALADYFEETLGLLGDPAQAKPVSNFVMGPVLRILNEQALALPDFPVEPARMAGLIRLRLDGALSSTAANEVFEALLESRETATEVAQRRNLLQVSDTAALQPVIAAVLTRSDGQVQQYLDGKTQVIGYLIGQVMKSFSGSPDPQVVRHLLTDALEARRTS